MRKAKYEDVVDGPVPTLNEVAAGLVAAPGFNDGAPVQEGAPWYAGDTAQDVAQVVVMSTAAAATAFVENHINPERIVLRAFLRALTTTIAGVTGVRIARRAVRALGE